MTLLEQWRDLAYQQQTNVKDMNLFWNAYFEKEKGFYAELLKTGETVTGTIPALAERYSVSETVMVGILDGINDSLKEPNPIETMDNETVLSLDYDTEKLYKNMVIAKADWLYGLPEWDSLLSEERRKELYKEAKASGTVVKGKKIGRNDPCPCGSGKKYKFCHGKNA